MTPAYPAKPVRIDLSLFQSLDVKNPALGKNLLCPFQILLVRQNHARFQAVLNLSLTQGRKLRIDQRIKCARVHDPEKRRQCVHVFFHENDHRTSPFGDSQESASHSPAQIHQPAAGILLIPVTHGDPAAILSGCRFQILQDICHNRLLIPPSFRSFRRPDSSSAVSGFTPPSSALFSGFTPLSSV